MHATIALSGLSSNVGHYYGSQASHLCRTIGCFAQLGACETTMGLWKLVLSENTFMSDPAGSSPVLFLKYMISPALETYVTLLGDSQWQKKKKIVYTAEVLSWTTLNSDSKVSFSCPLFVLLLMIICTSLGNNSPHRWEICINPVNVYTFFSVLF